MTYRVELSAEGNDDLRKIYEYIAFELGISDSAKAQIRRLSVYSSISQDRKSSPTVTT